MFSVSDRNQPRGNGVIVISSNIILIKCHFFFKGDIIGNIERVDTAEGEAKYKTAMCFFSRAISSVPTLSKIQ